SSGVMWQVIVIRTDLVAAGLEVLALLLLLVAAKSPQSNWRTLLVGVAAMLCTLGVVNKVQAIVPATAWPAVVMLFGVRTSGPASFWRMRAGAPLAIVAALAVLVIAVSFPVADLIHVGLTTTATSVFRLPPPLFGTSGVYQALLALWVIC